MYGANLVSVGSMLPAILHMNERIGNGILRLLILSRWSNPFWRFLLVFALIFRRFRRYLLLSFVALPSAIFLLGFIDTLLLDNACGPNVAMGPDGEQSFVYCASIWPEKSVIPLWILSTLCVWLLTYLLQRRLNMKHPFFGGKDLSAKGSETTTLNLSGPPM